MNPRNESGYDPVGDPRTGRPPLPHERERLRQAQPDEMKPDDIGGSRTSRHAAGESGGHTEDSSLAGSSVAASESSAAGSPSMMDWHASDGAEVAQSMKQSGEAVGAQMSAAGSAAMEQGSALLSTASHRVQGIAGELFAFARRKPLATLLGVAILGMIIGMLRRNRR
jgi:hypothetical protein